MKKSIIALSIFCLAIFSFAQQAPKAEEKPVIEFEMTTHDFGKIMEGRQVSCDFVFTNKGKAPLILANVQPSCGCTVPEWPREPILPGQKSKIKAVYNPGSFKGAFTKGITVTSNATVASVQLIIKGTVIEKPVEPVSPVRKQEAEGGF